MGSGKGSGDAVLSLVCLAAIVVLAGPILLIVYYARGPLLSTTKAHCVWWPELSASLTSGGTVSTDEQCTYRRVNITNLEKTSESTTDETWQHALVNNYILLDTSNTAADDTKKNLSEPFACYPFATCGGCTTDQTRACSKASETCSEECIWDIPLGYNPSDGATMLREANGEVIDYTTYANKRRIAVFMDPQEIEPVGIAVRNWGIGLTCFGGVLLVVLGIYVYMDNIKEYLVYRGCC
jgi:hypothetical protein